MAVFRIPAPDGTVLRFEGPDDATDDEIYAYAEAEFAKLQSVKPPAPAPVEQSTFDQTIEAAGNPTAPAPVAADAVGKFGGSAADEKAALAYAKKQAEQYLKKNPKDQAGAQQVYKARATEQLQDAQIKRQLATKNDSLSLSDVGPLLGIGAGTIARGAGELVGSETLTQAGQSAVDAYTPSLSEAAQNPLNPIAGTQRSVIESLPGTVVGGGIGGVLARGGAAALGATQFGRAAELSAAIAGRQAPLAARAALAAPTVGGAALGEGAVGAAAGAAGAAEKFDELKAAEIKASPRYQELVDSGLNDAEARAALRAEFIRKSAVQQGLATATIGALLPGVETRIAGSLAGRGIDTGKSLVTQAATTGGKETVQEFFQGGAEQIAANQATRALINPEQELTEGALLNASQSAIAGAVTGTALGGAAAASDRIAQGLQPLADLTPLVGGVPAPAVKSGGNTPPASVEPTSAATQSVAGDLPPVSGQNTIGTSVQPTSAATESVASAPPTVQPLAGLAPLITPGQAVVPTTSDADLLSAVGDVDASRTAEVRSVVAGAPGARSVDGATGVATGVGALGVPAPAVPGSDVPAAVPNQPALSAPRPVALTPELVADSVQTFASAGLNLKPVDLPANPRFAVAQEIANIFNRPLLTAEVSNVDPTDLAAAPDGAILPNGAVVLNRNSTDAPLAVVTHEVTHGLDADVKAAMLGAAVPTLQNKEEFQVRFLYGLDNDAIREIQAPVGGRRPDVQVQIQRLVALNQQRAAAAVTPEQKAALARTQRKIDDLVNEEMVAIITQEDAKGPAFWQDLRSKLGDDAFGKLATRILETLDKLIAGFRPRTGASKWTKDLPAVRSAITSALAEQSKRNAAKAAPAASTATESVAAPAAPQVRLAKPIADGRAFTGFFTNISAGETGRPNQAQYVPVLDVGGIREFVAEYNKHRGNFDDHIGASIPTFRELQTVVGAAIAKTYKSGSMLDIGASEGALVKAVSATTGGAVKTVALDPNFAMAKHFNDGQKVKGARYETSAFGTKEQQGQLAWVEDDVLTDRDGSQRPNPFAGEQVRYFKPTEKFDVVHEAMVFQFISGDRETQIARAKELMKPNGVLILEEKFVAGDGLTPEQFRENEKQKDAYKEQYFTKAEIAAKAKAVGVAEKVAFQAEQQKKESLAVGMNDLMVSPGTLETVLAGNFKNVTQFWDSGNFKGYVASDSQQAIDTLLGNMESVTSEFSKTETPRKVTGEQNAIPEPVIRSSRPVPPEAEPVVGVHYGKSAGLSTLSATSYGTGIRGAESARLAETDDARIKKRVYLYLKTGNAIPAPEAGLGPHVYQTTLQNIADPDNQAHLDAIRAVKQGTDANAFESAVLDAGFDGYLNTLQGTVVVLNKDVPVESLGNQRDLTLAQRAPSAAPRAATSRTEGNERVRRPQGNEVLDVIAAQRQIPVLKMEFGEARIPVAQVEEANAALAELGSTMRFARAPVREPSRAEKFLLPAERAKLRRDTATKFLEQFKQLPSGNEFAAVAFAGRAKRGWYRNSAMAMEHVFGPDAPRFAALLAATSPQTSVEANLITALNIWKNWIAAGRPQTRQDVTDIMARSVTGKRGADSVLDAWVNNSVRALTSQDPSAIVLSGPKVNSFMLNLRNAVEEVTNDAWMANFALVDQKMFAGSLNAAGTDPGKGPGYLAMSARVREAARILSDRTGETWTPAEVQETVWSWAKTLYELQTADVGAQELVYDGALTADLIGATPDFRTLFHENRNESILQAAGYGAQLATLRARSDLSFPAEEGSDAGGETTPFDPDAQQRYELRAAARLEQLRAGRLAESAATRAAPAAEEPDGGYDIPFSRPPVFYSELQTQIGKAPDRLATQPAPQWKAWLAGNSAKLGIKKDEIEWSGVNDYLDSRGKDKVTRDELVQFLDQAGVRVEEVVLGEPLEKPETARKRERFQELAEMEELSEAEQRESERLGQELMAAGPNPYLSDRAETQYGNYTLPGGENYRELLIVLPAPKVSEIEPWTAGRLRAKRDAFIDAGFTPLGVDVAIAAATEADGVEAAVRRLDAKIGSGVYRASEKEALTILRAAVSGERKNKAKRLELLSKSTYKSSHWDTPNVVAHLRIDDRFDADGKRVLFINEIQSDWGQDGKRKGFAQRYAPGDVVPIAAADDPAANQPDLFWYFRAAGEVLQIPKSKYADQDAARDYIVREKRINSGGVPPAPFVTKTESWVGLALKRAITYAAQNGYDKVAMVKGQQAADFFDLSKQVDRIDATRRPDGTFDIDVATKDGRDFNQSSLTEAQLEDTVGKDMAVKIAQATEGSSKRARFSGLDLKVGGEGMRTFYDKIVPQVARDVLKKIGGPGLTTVEIAAQRFTGGISGVDVMVANGIPATQQVAYWRGLEQQERDQLIETERQRLSQGLIQPGFDITPELREKASNGLPMFSRPDSAEFKAWFADSKVVDAEGRPLVVYHGTLSDDFNEFDTNQYEGGAFFSTSPEVASSFADPYRTGNDPEDYKPRVIPAFLSLRNPKVLQAEDVMERYNQQGRRDPGGVLTHSFDKMRRAMAEAKQEGYDGAFIAGTPEANGIVADQWVAFRPEQIKSAIGNNGQFDPTNPDIRFARPSQQYGNQLIGGMQFTLPTEGGVMKLRRQLQDYFLRVQVVQDAILAGGGTIGEAQDVYRAEERSYGRMEEQLKDFARFSLEPMLRDAAAAKIDLEELALYAYAKHAPEANAYIASINPGLPDGGSGMTDAEAAAVIAKAQTEGKINDLDALHAQLMGIADSTRRVLLDEGLISQDEFNSWQGQFQNYVPLKGFAAGGPEGRPGAPTGRGFDIKGKETLRRLGRTSRAGDIIETMIKDFERAVVRGERNQVAKVFLDLALKNPDPTLWEVAPKTVSRGIDPSSGLVRQTIVDDKGPDTVSVKVGGQEVRIKVKDELLLRAMKKAATDETGATTKFLMQSVGWYSTWMRNTLTRYNPVFGAINAVRDVQFGLAATLDELGAEGAKLFAKYYAQGAMVSGRYETGRLDQNARASDRAFEEYRAAGATTGGFYQRDVEDISKDLRRMLVAAGAAPRNAMERVVASRPADAARAALRALEIIGSVSENAARFAAYRAARDMGRTPAQAASIAKNLTTNFNRKGEWGQAVNALYLFFNAAVQGSARTLKMMTNRRMQYVFAGVVGFTAALTMLNADVGGEDEDGQTNWDKIPDYEKERNLIIMLPPGMNEPGTSPVGKSGRYIKIPMAYGLNIFPVLGMQMADVYRNQRDSTRGVSIGKAGINMASAVFGSFNPFGGAVDPTNTAQVALAVAPTLLDLPIQAVMGVNAFGRPTGSTKFPGDTRPDSEVFQPRQAGGPALYAARKLNAMTGGTQTRPGLVDLSASDIENLVRNIGGGTGQFLFDVGVNVPTKLMAGQPMTNRDVPLVKQFYGKIDPTINLGLAYERRNEALKEANQRKAAEELGIDEEMTPEQKKLMALAGPAEEFTKAMSTLRKAEIAFADNKENSAGAIRAKRKELELQRARIAQQFNANFVKIQKELRE